ncbi:MAG: hypothetical protein EHM67_05415 [Hyphomicrobiaceae bacterium]|nr:MAG: hypothetical protein EHM67_05415 [Hyphomicrobiaceae bacterium]
MVAELIGTAADPTALFPSAGVAKGLGPDQRKELSIRALAGGEPVAQLAARHRVSRKFVYRQARRAGQALDEAFTQADGDDRVLFQLPVTKAWLRQWVLAQVLIGHTSYRGVGEIFDAAFGLPGPSVGTVHNILQESLPHARAVNDATDLGGIGVGAHDEIYQAGRPVLVGADVRSTYCYLLAEEDRADETAWGVHLLDLAAKGLDPTYTIADGGRGLRAGQRAAWPDTPCHGDVFHAERELGRLAFFLEHRAAGCVSARLNLQRKMERSKRRGQGNKFSKRLAIAGQAETGAVQLAADIRILADWMSQDILAKAGPSQAVRRELFDFVVAELSRRQPLCPHRIGPVCQALGKQRDDLLAFVGVQEDPFAVLAQRLDVPGYRVRQIADLEALDRNSAAYWQAEGQLRHQLKGRFAAVQREVRGVIDDTPRASSIIENLNSRLRNYFFLRRDLGDGYLDLLRFFLNHRRFRRSDRPERVGKSPAELLTGQPHAHWLELLGFQRFARN